MSDSLRDQLKRMKKSGKLRLGLSGDAPKPAGDPAPSVTARGPQKNAPKKTGGRARPTNAQQARTKKPMSAEVAKKQMQAVLQVTQQTYGPSAVAKPATLTQLTPTVSNAPAQWLNWKLLIRPGARISEHLKQDLAIQHFPYLEQPPLRTAEVRNAREIADLRVGLDFGTSTVKIVISDVDSGDSFAVPFAAAQGVARYLLPSSISRNNGQFCLGDGEQHERDLKLFLLANPENKAAQSRVLALWAAAVRHALRWFFDTHQIYTHKKCIWRLSIGIPAKNQVEPSKKELFERLARAAWAIGAADEDITPTVLADVLAGTQLPARRVGDELESVEAIAELAAQIYGFTVYSLDPNDPRHDFLILDIGAGTIDVSLFHVGRKDGKTNVILFASEVKPHGVSNLNAHRVGWWCDRLRATDPGNALIASLEAMRFVSDMQRGIPESYDDYLEDVEIDSAAAPALSPDEWFFKKYVDGLGWSAMNHAQREGFFDVHRGHLAGLPLFVCGGGTRMEFFNRLKRTLTVSQPGTPNRFCKLEDLVQPKSLRAQGLEALDYDRLSVAYGLSRIDVGRVSWAAPMSPANTKIDFEERYVSKDAC